MPADNVRQLLMIIDQAYDRVSWHGTNLRGSIRGLSAKDAAWRPRPGRHNIWEVVVHAAYWKYAVRRRLRAGRASRSPTMSASAMTAISPVWNPASSGRAISPT